MNKLSITLGEEKLPLDFEICLSCKPASADGKIYGFGETLEQALTDLQEAYHDLQDFAES